MRRKALVVASAIFMSIVVPRIVVSGDDFYYREDDNGALVLTNVPDDSDLRRYASRKGIPGLKAGQHYRGMIEAAGLKHGVHPDLVFAVAAVESNFDPRAISSKGARGLMQLMPKTAERFGVGDSFDPGQNVDAGARYLRYLLDLFDGDKKLALAAYNAGENAVLENGTIPPYRETRNYVTKVLRIFGTNRKPYAAAPRSGPADGRPAPAPEIFTYTDSMGVVHISDQPPAGTPPSDSQDSSRP